LRFAQRALAAGDDQSQHGDAARGKIKRLSKPALLWDFRL